ncbi:hypothetical protein [Aestuariivirga sp.]|uniref:hypothetical protein n=1 Tax=Aestuariivirga sp. TaxID=2650926 RepID=UPI003BA9E612
MRGIPLPPVSGALLSQMADPATPQIMPGQQPQDFAFGDALARPLFDETRRPFRQPPQAPLAELAQPPQPTLTTSPPTPENTGLRLAGVYLSGDRQLALVQSPENPAGSWLGRGDNISGWRVDKIFSGQVTLQSNGQRSELQLYVEDSPKMVDQQE